MEEPVAISRSRRKREMLALQDLGQELVALSAHRLAQIDLPAPLLKAVLAATRISKFGALRR